MKKKHKSSIFSTVVLSVIVVTVTLWLLLMSLFTWAVAKDFYLQLQDGIKDWASSTFHFARLNVPLHEAAQKLAYDNFYIRTVPLLPIIDAFSGRYNSDSWVYGRWGLMYGYQAAIELNDEENNIHLRSGDYIFFEYQDDYYYIDLKEAEEGKEFADKFIDTSPGGDDLSIIFLDTTYMTGYFEGNRFYPEKIQGFVDYSFTLPDSDRQTVEIQIPITNLKQCYNYDPGEPFQWQGKTYQNAAELLDEKQLKTGFGLFGSVICARTRYNTGAATAVVYCKPLEQALLQTWHLWLITGIALAVFLILYIRRIRRDITLPLKIANQRYAVNDKSLYISVDSGIRELDLLGDHIEEAQQDRHEAHNRIQQLETALNYAKEAEENRRRLINALAHELKTPLAVIHSYAEGLQEEIAEEKKAQYLSVLLDESEKIDAMVKEMLDFSRLEAGKVTLATESFSLAKLTIQVFDRFALAAQGRELSVTWEQMEEFPVVADVGRIRHVIANLADNAIKYTTEGGSIRVQVYKKYGNAFVAIENDCPPLSQEALEHVWDSFYRADASRSSGGTGLGLAIVKSIVTLHRGDCSVRNIEGGVRFSFRIPL